MDMKRALCGSPRGYKPDQQQELGRANEACPITHFQAAPRRVIVAILAGDPARTGLENTLRGVEDFAPSATGRTLPGLCRPRSEKMRNVSPTVKSIAWSLTLSSPGVPSRHTRIESIVAVTKEYVSFTNCCPIPSFNRVSDTVK